MIIRDIMSNGVAECTEDASLSEVYDLIQQSESGYAVVLDSSTHRVPIGIVNEHSICQQVVARGRNPKGLHAGNVMNSRIRRVSENTDIAACEGLVETAASEPILVTNEKRQFTGIVDRSRLSSAVCSLKKNLANPDAEFSNLMPVRTPARVEIPAFGWMS
jgi:predicted transcriptional regulator